MKSLSISERYGWSRYVAQKRRASRRQRCQKENLGSVGWNLSKEQVAKLDAASNTQPAYPYWHQRQFANRNPIPTSPR
jgi:hypothetical protein